jgi:hypothetical protein
LKKPIILFLALLLPACVFVFLKNFGENQFDVAPLFSTELPEGFSACGDSLELPYHVPTTFQSKFLTSTMAVTLVYIQSTGDDLSRALDKVKDKYGDKINYQAAEWSQDIKCALLLTAGYDIVIVDKNAVIRGQYKSDNRDEIDRLMMELSILFKDY